MNLDNTINIYELFMAATAFGSNPAHPRWNPLADLNYDDAASVFDLFSVLRDLGKTVS